MNVSQGLNDSDEVIGFLLCVVPDFEGKEGVGRGMDADHDGGHQWVDEKVHNLK